MDKREEQDRRKIEEYKKHPMSNFSDSINSSMIGDISQLTKGSCLTRIITGVVIIGILLLVYHFL